MDTNQYETFEYLQPSNQETITKRLFVVQDNGTYLTLDRTVDLTQVQNVELLEDVQPVYNVSSEQFYIDVDGSQELQVSEPFILSNELHEEENIYGNDLMLQQGSSSSDIQQIQQPVGHIPDNVVEEFITKNQCTVDNNMNMEVDTASSLTEIMISDEQYKLLQQKGWTLVDNNDSIYFIDGFGLHNITKNDQLIQELKEKIRRNNESNETEKDTSNMITVTMFGDSYENNAISEATTIPYIKEIKDSKTKSSINERNRYPKLKAVRILPKPEKSPSKVPDSVLSKRKLPEPTGLSENCESSDTKINSNTIKIKTKFLLKDIPSEIVLGKTANGKKLVARVTKRERREPASNKTDVAMQEKQSKTSETNAFDHKIENLIQEAIRSEVSASIDKEVVTNANRIVQQLLRVPAFKPAVIEKRLIITKISITEDEDHNVKEERGPTLITGRVMSNGNDKWVFTYVPDMFQKLKESADVEGNKGNDFLQIHIQEVIGPDGNARCSITLNGRVILLKFKETSSFSSNINKKLQRVYACGTCAAIFNTELKYLQHHELHHVSDNSKTNTVKPSALYNTLKLGSNNVFDCNRCRFQTSNLRMIYRHIKYHSDILTETDKEPGEIFMEDQHKCKLCSVSYRNASTLSKHLVSTHIKPLDT